VAGAGAAATITHIREAAAAGHIQFPEMFGLGDVLVEEDRGEEMDVEEEEEEEEEDFEDAALPPAYDHRRRYLRDGDDGELGPGDRMTLRHKSGDERRELYFMYTA
jgi:hypothetical protein